MSTRCSRCGLAVRISTEFCPACGIELLTRDEPKVNARDSYYEALELTPTASRELIHEKLKEAHRLWGRRANNSPTVELRHEAERKVLLLEEAEAILLNPAKRRAYDLTLQQRHSGAPPDGRPLPVPVRRRPLPVPAKTKPEPNPIKQPEGNANYLLGSDFWRFFGWRALEGTIIQADPSYMGHPDFSWAGLLVKLTLLVLAVIVVGPIVIGVLIGLALVALMFSFLFPSSSSRSTGCLTSLASQMVGFFLTKRMFGSKPDILVRDFRLRDAEGQEHLVRVKGELISGNIGVGDEVELEGIDRRGTLNLRRGINLRTRSEIRVGRR